MGRADRVDLVTAGCSSRAVGLRDGRGSRPPQGDGDSWARVSAERDRIVAISRPPAAENSQSAAAARGAPASASATLDMLVRMVADAAAAAHEDHADVGDVDHRHAVMPGTARQLEHADSLRRDRLRHLRLQPGRARHGAGSHG